jgi:hypothetical protein
MIRLAYSHSLQEQTFIVVDEPTFNAVFPPDACLVTHPIDFGFVVDVVSDVEQPQPPLFSGLRAWSIAALFCRTAMP